jgi:hypothetical protein
MSAPTIYDSFQFLAAAWEVEKRILDHTGNEDGLLKGLHYDSEGTLKVDGEDQFPLLQPWSVHTTEKIFAGAPSDRGKGVDKSNPPVEPELVLTFRLAASRKHKWFRRDPTDESKPKGFLEWLALVCDAIETPYDEEVDPDERPVDSRLSKGLIRPVAFAIRESECSQLRFQSFLEITLGVRAMCRGERSFTMPQ